MSEKKTTKKKPAYQQMVRQFADSIDARYSFDTKEDFQAYMENEGTAYSGQQVYIVSEDTLYYITLAETEETIDVKWHEVVTDCNVGHVLTKTPVLTDSINKIYADVQEAVNNIDNDREHTVATLLEKIGELLNGYGALFGFLKSKYPDDEFFKEPEPESPAPEEQVSTVPDNESDFESGEETSDEPIEVPSTEVTSEDDTDDVVTETEPEATDEAPTTIDEPVDSGFDDVTAKKEE